MGASQPTARKRAAVYVKAALQALDDAGDSLPSKQILQELQRRIAAPGRKGTAAGKLSSSRWKILLHLRSLTPIKIGFTKARASRTGLPRPSGIKAPHPADAVIERSTFSYLRWWRRRNDEASPPAECGSCRKPLLADDGFAPDVTQSRAREEIEGHVRDLGPYEFQDLVAALLRAMGYSTPFVAPKGPDGGTDIIAYQDPLGAKTPHIRVQVKHRRDAKATRNEIAALRGVLRQDRETGLFISSGGFSSMALREARQGAVHIELMDLGRFLELWTQLYDRMPEEDRTRLRLRRIYHLSSG